MDLLPAETPYFLTVREFRELTGASRGLAYRLVSSGRVVAVRLGQRGGLRIPRAELEKFLASRTLRVKTNDGSAPQREEVLRRLREAEEKAEKLGGLHGPVRAEQREISEEIHRLHAELEDL